MPVDTRKLAPAVLTAAALALAGCGASDQISIPEAKEKLALDCEQGRFADREHCRCLADELQARGKTGPQIDALRKAINFGTRRTEVTQAARACDERLAIR